MVQDSYFLSGWRRRVCRVAAWLFLSTAAVYGVGTIIAGGVIATHASAPTRPSASTLTITYRPAELLRISAPATRHLDVALRDLRRATVAALLAAVTPPLRDSVIAMIAYPGTPEGRTWYFEADFADLALALLLAIAAWIVTWAIAEGSRAARALDDFV